MTTMETNSGEQTPPKERKMTLTQKESTIIVRLSNEGADMGFVGAFAGLEKSHDNEEMMIKFIKELLEKKKLITAINFIIREEIRGNGLSLLREESLGSSLLKCLWFQFVGKNYMNQVIKPFVKEVYKIAKKPLEINPAFTNGDTQKAKKNLEKLLGLVQNFLSTFFYSTDHVPADFEEVLFTLYMLLTETEGARKSHLGLGYSEDALRLFGGFFLLRFICPAIVSPQKYGLMKEQDFNPNVQKTLVQVSKILQSIANQIEFDPKKDPHMIPANDVIQWCMPQMLAFLNKLMTKIDRSESY